MWVRHRTPTAKSMRKPSSIGLDYPDSAKSSLTASPAKKKRGPAHSAQKPKPKRKSTKALQDSHVDAKSLSDHKKKGS